MTFIRVLGKGGCEPGRDFVGNGQIRKNRHQISGYYLKIRDKAKKKESKSNEDNSSQIRS